MPLYPCEMCQIQIRSLDKYTHVVRQSKLMKHFIYMIKRINDSIDDLKKKAFDGWIIVK